MRIHTVRLANRRAGHHSGQTGRFPSARPTIRQARPFAQCDEGIALVVVMMATLLVGAVVAGLVVVTSADTLIASNVGAASEAFYAADAAFERTLAELQALPDLSSVLSGTVLSAFRDGTPTGTKRLADGSSLDLAWVLSQASCSKATTCSGADLDAVRSERPWGPLNPQWRLFSYGPLDPAPRGIHSGLPVYVVSMVADDPTESDGDPARDGVRTGASTNPGAGVVLVRADAFGRRGAHRTIEGLVIRRDLATLARWEAADPFARGSPPVVAPTIQVAGWREVR